jgi:hypothetical protein
MSSCARLCFLNELREDEEDLLDRAWGLEPNSRLSCQAILAQKDLVVEIPRTRSTTPRKTIEHGSRVTCATDILGHRNHRLYADQGDRIIEDRLCRAAQPQAHRQQPALLSEPGRDSHEDALKVHGISNEFLRDKPPLPPWSMNCWTIWRGPRSSSTTPPSTSAS